MLSALARTSRAVLVVALGLWSACGAGEEAPGFSQQDGAAVPDVAGRDVGGVGDTGVVTTREDAGAEVEEATVASDASTEADGADVGGPDDGGGDTGAPPEDVAPEDTVTVDAASEVEVGCTGPACCASDEACADEDPCTADRCGSDGRCSHAPITGLTAASCYEGDPVTSGVGPCRAGRRFCTNGVAGACVDQRLPGSEVCNAVDDDCDGRSDEDTEPQCFPYLCAGADGCAKDCVLDGDCAAGNYCGVGGFCETTGEDGASCSDDNACAGSHCENGWCCPAGLCCHGPSDCTRLDDLVCDAVTAEGCVGHRVSGTCGADFACDSTTVSDASACAGGVCQAARCEAGGVAVPASYCAGDGGCKASGPPAVCSPYACKDGACKTTCLSQADCAAGGVCTLGVCRELPDGGVCTEDAQCASQHCRNGFCCADGICCGTSDDDCASFDEPGVCGNPSGCGGTAVVGVCGANHQCDGVVIAAPEACLGERCGASECTNLDGGNAVKEGLVRKVCSAAGSCETEQVDCRLPGQVSFCSADSDFFLCAGCTPKRSACVALGVPCSCSD